MTSLHKQLNLERLTRLLHNPVSLHTLHRKTHNTTVIGGQIGRGAGRIINAMVRGLARHTVNPNTLTVIGVLINLVCGLLFGFGYFFYAGLVLIVANLFDMLDGKLARSTNQVTAFGGFLDSSLDRLSDMVVLVGVLIFYARDTPYHSTLNVFLVSAAIVGSVLISYTSARAESLIPKCDVGFFRRPERVVLLIIGALSTHHGSTNFFANRMPAVLWILAIGSYWTFAHRMFHTWRETQRIVAATAMTTANAAPDETSTKSHAARPTQEQLDAARRASISR